jgi:hypothetical protein
MMNGIKKIGYLIAFIRFKTRTQKNKWSNNDKIEELYKDFNKRDIIK